MGLFSTILHLYKTTQEETINKLVDVISTNRGLNNFSKLGISNSDYRYVLENTVFGKEGAYYLITQPHGSWLTIIELNINIKEPFYLYELNNILSNHLRTYALSFHLYDNDVLYYNLDKCGSAIDGYNSNYQYFLTEPAGKNEILSQRHKPGKFSDILPAITTPDDLNEILNEGYWNAFDNDKLDEDGIPDNDTYFIDEHDRFERLGKKLEIYNKGEYPFADWLNNVALLNLSDCYLLKAVI